MSTEIPMNDVEVVKYNGVEIKKLVIDNMNWVKRSNFIPTLNHFTQLYLSRTAGKDDNTLKWAGLTVTDSGSTVKVCQWDTLHISCSTTRSDYYCDYEDEEIYVPGVAGLATTITREYTALPVGGNEKIFFSGNSLQEELSDAGEYPIGLGNDGINVSLYPSTQGTHIKISGKIQMGSTQTEFTWHRVVNSINSDGSINLGLREGLDGGSSFVMGALRYTISPVKLCNNPYMLRVGVSTAADRAVPSSPSLSIYPKITITSISSISHSQLMQPSSISDSMTTSEKITVSISNQNPLPVTAYITVYDNAMRDVVVGSTSEIIKARGYAELAIPLTSSYDSTSQVFYEVWFEDHDKTKKDFLFEKSNSVYSQ